MKNYTFVIKFTCLLIVVVLLREYYLSITTFPNLESEVSLYETFGISDWLINYRGGFVRRGLAGEVLWLLYQIHPYNVVYVIIGITAISLIALTALCVILFRRMGWPLWILLFPMFLYSSYYGLGGQLGFRRDTLLLLLSYLLFWQYKKYVKGGGISRFCLLSIWILSILIILLHEGVIFSIFPFLVLHTFVINNTSATRAAKNLLLLWFPSAITLVAVISFHGNDNISELIWKSWMPCFMAYPYSDSIPPIGLGPSFLSSSFSDGYNLAKELTWKPYFIACIPAWPFNIYLFIAFYYLFTRMGIMSIRNKRRIPDHVQMSNIFLFQLVFTTPMLGIIGCDWFRSIPICCITSCFLCFLFPEHQNVPAIINRFSEWIQRIIGKSYCLGSSWVYYIVLISLPFCHHCARPGGMFPFIPLDLKGKLLETVMEWI